MDESQLRMVLEQHEVSSSEIEEILEAYRQTEGHTVEPKVAAQSLRQMLELEAMKTADWRQRAAIMAKIISLELE